MLVKKVLVTVALLSVLAPASSFAKNCKYVLAAVMTPDGVYHEYQSLTASEKAVLSSKGYIEGNMFSSDLLLFVYGIGLGYGNRAQAIMKDVDTGEELAQGDGNITIGFRIDTISALQNLPECPNKN